MPDLPELDALLPQRGAMRLLSRVLAHEPLATVCEARACDATLFRDENGSIPSWLALEYMAQCMAVHAGLTARSRGEALRPGLLLGTRRLSLAVAHFAAEATLRVEARHHRGESGLVAFDCAVRDAQSGEPLAEGRVNVYTLRDWAELEEPLP